MIKLWFSNANGTLKSFTMDWKCYFFIVNCFILFNFSDSLLSYDEHTVCKGTNLRFGKQSFPYRSLIMRYERNCTYIDGNLEITSLDGELDYDLSFLSTIQVVTGYVLIGINFASVIPLHNLAIIRGMELFEHQGKQYSLFVTLNYNQNNRESGLKELQLKNLHDILRGDIYFNDNRDLCHENSIIWDDIKSEEAKVEFSKGRVEYCPACHPDCDGHCWGAAADMCQTLTKTVCSSTCDHRCRGSTPDKCCHRECAGGCTGGTARDCYACMNFNNDGRCETFCPQRRIYDPRTYTVVPNPDGKYSYASLCVPECPDRFLTYEEQSSCVPKCPTGYRPDSINKNCVKCDGACPKSCPGNNARDHKFAAINANNIRNFTGCTIIEGHLTISINSFDEDPYYNVGALRLEDLEVLKTVREVTHYVRIQNSHIKDLSFLSNLEYIRGREVTPAGASLEVVRSPDLESLELRSLKELSNGRLVLFGNPKLCYLNNLNYALIGASTFLNKGNPSNDECERNGSVCHTECSQDGCWGPGNENCLRCAHKKLDKGCVSWCDPDLGVYDGANNICYHCHGECALKCEGPGADNCTACKNVKDGPFCRKECPLVKYQDLSTNTCRECHELCGDNGCSGPYSYVGGAGCNSCDLSVRNESSGMAVYECRHKSLGCPTGYHSTDIVKGVLNTTEQLLVGKIVCYQCHVECETCFGEGPSRCHPGRCRNVRFGSECRDMCPSDFFADPITRNCKKCHDQCRKGCDGPLFSDCHRCKNKKVYVENTNKTEFNCTQTCPPGYIYVVKEKDTGEDVCSIDDPDSKQATITIAGSVAGVVGGVVMFIILAVVAYHLRQRANSKERTAALTAKMTGMDDSEEPLTPSDAKPDLSKLRLIKEFELRKGSIIGSGAFGTVYKGVWIPDGENVKIPVAIKVLQEGTSPNQNKELLEEARVMASVEHIYCVRILAVCMTAQMMLVTQLMPLGCLLDYVRKHRENIGSKTLLNWCTQIAKGMSYLEGRGIVHRDLAARNVLVQNSNMVKITDFGLAKLLDFEENEYHAAGGKMPIKWLALECIQHRVFTHKTDVWSFGVTVWELFTYGQKPYENVRAKDVPELLEKGERLVQPTICTIDVYMIMIKCWMLDADSRPSFLELADEFAKMARDPGRYLVIQGDRLMRLPSQSYDAHDVMRSLSVAVDGPEEILDADEYLQPSEYQRDAEPTSPVSPFSPPYGYGRNSLSKKPLLEGDDTGATGNQYYPKRDKLKYGHLEAAAAAKNENLFGRDRGDSFNTRYCSDPLGRQMLASVREAREGEAFVEDTDDMPDAPPVPLVVDEDDYLQPRSQCPQYIDIDENEKIEMQEMDSKAKQKPEYENIRDKPVKIDIMSALDNPEYFDSIGGKVSPPSNTRQQANGNSRLNHDYYNELDSTFRDRNDSEC